LKNLEWRCWLVLPLLLALGACAGPGSEQAREEDAAAPAKDEKPAEAEGPPPAWILAALVQPRGLVKDSPAAAPGYVLFSQLTSDTSYLVDRKGQVVHTWASTRGAEAGYLQPDGSLVRLARMTEPPNFKAGGVTGYVQRLSWDGELLWEWQMGDAEKILHHDLEVLPNGNILIIGWEQIDAERAKAAGRRPDLIPEQGLWADWILEIEPKPPNDARIVWEWHVWDHLVQNHDPAAPNHGDPAAYPHRLDINANAEEQVVDPAELDQLKAIGYAPPDATQQDLESDFLHMNSIEYHPRLDQIMVSVPEVGEIWIIDHSTTTEEARGSKGGRHGRGGDLLYRWGNPRTYGRGTKEDQQLFYQHQAQWIPEGWDRAGNVTLFNNGGDRNYSSVIEFAPPIGPDGSYPLADGAPWGPPKPAWTYEAKERETFYAPFISGTHRLANGHTFVCSGPQGRFFEVTPAGEIVWEYLNPYHREVPGWHPESVEKVPFAAYRATKIPPDHPAFAGRDLKPLDPQPEPYQLPPPPPPPA
jgi:hypothetical protein